MTQQSPQINWPRAVTAFGHCNCCYLLLIDVGIITANTSAYDLRLIGRCVTVTVRLRAFALKQKVQWGINAAVLFISRAVVLHTAWHLVLFSYMFRLQSAASFRELHLLKSEGLHNVLRVCSNPVAPCGSSSKLVGTLESNIVHLVWNKICVHKLPVCMTVLSVA